MNNITSVLNALAESEKHNLCEDFNEKDNVMCDSLYDTIQCNNCPLCCTNGVSIKSINNFKSKYSE